MQQRWRRLLKINQDKIAGILTASVAWGVYWFTLAPDITWAHYGVDGGDLITAVLTRGNPHPSGYPTYLILGYLIEKIPIWPLAFRFNILSAITMAAAAGFLATTVYHLSNTNEKSSGTMRLVMAVAIGLTFSFSTLIWGQATITEIYGLFMLTCAAFIWALFTQKTAWLTGLLLGLTITMHTTGLLLLPLVLLKTSKKQWGTFGGGLLLGLLPFAFLPFLSSPASPVAWGDLSTVSGWWWIVSSEMYRGYVFSLPPNLWLSRLSEWSHPFFAQFTWAGMPLIIVGFILASPKNRRLNSVLLATAVLFFFSAFFYNTNDAIIFTLPAWLILSLLLLPAYKKLRWAALALPVALILINFGTNNLKDDKAIRTHTESLLTEIPDKAVVETPGDPTIFTLWYFIYGETQRTDIIPVDSNLFAFDWYRNRLQLLYPDLQGLEIDNLQTFRRKNQHQRPYCFASLTQKDEAGQKAYSLTCTDILTTYGS